MWRILRSASPMIFYVKIRRNNARFSRHWARASLTRLIMSSTSISSRPLSVGINYRQVFALYLESL